jgi:hypothetical protein
MEAKRAVNVYCRTCKIGSPRDLAELARPSGKTCLVCGATLIDEIPWPIIELKDESPC